MTYDLIQLSVWQQFPELKETIYHSPNVGCISRVFGILLCLFSSLYSFAIFFPDKSLIRFVLIYKGLLPFKISWKSHPKKKGGNWTTFRWKWWRDRSIVSEQRNILIDTIIRQSFILRDHFVDMLRSMNEAQKNVIVITKTFFCAVEHHIFKKRLVYL